MGAETGIEWTDATWNPIVGCSIVSPGCTNCYAMKMAARIQKINRTGGSNSNYVNHYDGTTHPSKAGPVWTGKIAVAPDNLFLKPLSWKKPRRIFVNSMGDLFHESVPDEWIDRVFAVMALCPQHTFQVLSKRSARMRAYLTENAYRAPYMPDLVCEQIGKIGGLDPRMGAAADSSKPGWPLPNVWLGVSAEDQQRADERIPDLLATPAAVRFVSAEPLLGPVDLTRICLLPQKPGSLRAGIHVDVLEGRYCESGVAYTGDWDIAKEPPPDSDRRKIDWVIVGGESGPNARPMHPDWARSLRDQCQAAGVAYFFKQWGASVPFITGEPNGHWVWRRVGKKAAGALLDGREWREFPQ